MMAVIPWNLQPTRESGDSTFTACQPRLKQPVLDAKLLTLDVCIKGFLTGTSNIYVAP